MLQYGFYAYTSKGHADNGCNFVNVKKPSIFCRKGNQIEFQPFSDDFEIDFVSPSLPILVHARDADLPNLPITKVPTKYYCS